MDLRCWGVLQDNLVLSTEWGWTKARTERGRGREGQRANARNVSFGISLRWPIHIINSVDETKLLSNNELLVKAFELVLTDVSMHQKNKASFLEE